MFNNRRFANAHRLCCERLSWEKESNGQPVRDIRMAHALSSKHGRPAGKPTKREVVVGPKKNRLPWCAGCAAAGGGGDGALSGAV